MATKSSWEQLGRKDAENRIYLPPTNSSQARMSYQYGWEEAADDKAWKARITEEE